MKVEVWVGVESWPEDGNMIVGVSCDKDEAFGMAAERNDCEGPFDLEIPIKIWVVVNDTHDSRPRSVHASYEEAMDEARIRCGGICFPDDLVLGPFEVGPLLKKGETHE